MDASDLASSISLSSTSRKRKCQPAENPSKRPRNQPVATTAGVFSCFTLDGDEKSFYRRTKFSSERKVQVRDVRKKGACLRCRLLKRACSGEDPCKMCISVAKAAAGSRSLMWMECVRPSFHTMNVFEKGAQQPNQLRFESILRDLLDDDVYLDFHIPFALNVEAASSHLASWLSDDGQPSTFSVVGVFSCSTNTNLLENSLNPSLGRDLRLFVHLTTLLYTTDLQDGYYEYKNDEIQAVRDFVGNRLLMTLDPLLRPSEIEASTDKLGKLKSLFLLLLGITVGMRYTDLENNHDPLPPMSQAESKQEALQRLLCHYLIYIGKSTSLLEDSTDEKTLVNKWKTEWNKPASFTWNVSNGLEMHYQIEPPLSTSEDESICSIDLELCDLDDTGAFTFDADMLKCVQCDTFWAELDGNGLCQDCGSTSKSQQTFQILDSGSESLWSEIYQGPSSQDASAGALNVMVFTGIEDSGFDALFLDDKFGWSSQNTLLSSCMPASYLPGEGMEPTTVRLEPSVPPVPKQRSRSKRASTCWHCTSGFTQDKKATSLCRRCSTRETKAACSRSPLSSRFDPFNRHIDGVSKKQPPHHHPLDAVGQKPTKQKWQCMSPEPLYPVKATHSGNSFGGKTGYHGAQALSTGTTNGIALSTERSLTMHLCESCVYSFRQDDTHWHGSGELQGIQACSFCCSALGGGYWCNDGCKDRWRMRKLLV